MGRNLFTSIGCTSCHSGTVFSGGNFDTGVETLEDTLLLAGGTPTADTGNGGGAFQAPPLFGLRKDQFFHTGLLGNNSVAAPGQTLLFTNLRDAVSFYVTAAFAGSPEGPSFSAVQAMTAANIEDIAHFLEAISSP